MLPKHTSLEQATLVPAGPSTTRKKNRAFTLVELSIVLVIIGLIVASVLVGQDLIRQAELRATLTQYDQFNAAVATFRTKYGGIPGDLGNAATFFSGGTNGNGDGILTSTVMTSGTATAAMDTETQAFWDQLDSGNAALIPGTYTPGTASLGVVFPRSKIGQGWGVWNTAISGTTTSSAANYFVLGASNTASNVYSITGILNPLDARSIDVKVDDGIPLRGATVVRVTGTGEPGQGAPYTQVGAAAYSTAAGGNSSGCILGSTAAYASANDAIYTYDVQNTGVNCALLMRMVQ